MNNDIAASLRQQTELCAEGETPGTVGHAINTAVDVHTRIAATPIDTDGLFNGNDCFDQLMDVIDLSSTVIDFSNIWASAQQALIQWAQRRVCTTVNDMANRVLEPVNNTIEAINDMADVNGHANGAIREGMRRIDPNLGNIYRDARPAGNETYQLNVGGNQQNGGGNAAQGGGVQPRGLATKNLKSSQANKQPSQHGGGISGEASQILKDMKGSLEAEQASFEKKMKEAQRRMEDRQGTPPGSMPSDLSEPYETPQPATTRRSESQRPRSVERSEPRQDTPEETSDESSFEYLQRLFSQ